MLNPLKSSICVLAAIALLSGCAVKSKEVSLTGSAAPQSTPVAIEHSIRDALEEYLTGKDVSYPNLEKMINLTQDVSQNLDKDVWNLCVEDQWDFEKPMQILQECEDSNGTVKGKDENGNPYEAHIVPGKIYEFEVDYVEGGNISMQGKFDPESDSVQCDFLQDEELLRTFEFSKQESGGFAGQVYSRYDGDTFYCSRTWFDGKAEGNIGMSVEEYALEPESIFDNPSVPLNFVNKGVPYAYCENNVLTMQVMDQAVTVDYNEEEIVSGDFAGASYDNHISTADGDLSTDLNLPLQNMIPALYLNNAEIPSTMYYFYQPRKKPRFLFVSTKALDGNLMLPYQGELLPVKATRSGKDIQLVWKKDGISVCELSMKTTSTMLTTPDGEIDMQIRPSARSGGAFIPVYAVLNAIGGGVSMNPSSQEAYHIYSGAPLENGPIAGTWSSIEGFTGEQDLADGKYIIEQDQKLRAWMFDEFDNCKLLDLYYDGSEKKWVLLWTMGSAQLHGRILAIEWQTCGKSTIEDLSKADWEMVYDDQPIDQVNPPKTSHSSTYVVDWTNDRLIISDNSVYYNTAGANTAE